MHALGLRVLSQDLTVIRSTQVDALPPLAMVGLYDPESSGSEIPEPGSPLA